MSSTNQANTDLSDKASEQTQALPSWLSAVRFDAQGLVPVIAQERGSGDVLMFAWMNREALLQTVACGEAVYFSRSRQRLWHKGEASGNTQTVHSLRLDCDADVVLLSVTQNGHQPSVACHTGRHTCFYRLLADDNDTKAWQETDPVLQDPEQMYKK